MLTTPLRTRKPQPVVVSTSQARRPRALRPAATVAATHSAKTKTVGAKN